MSNEAGWRFVDQHVAIGASLATLAHWVAWVAGFVPTFEIGDRVERRDWDYPGFWQPEPGVYTVTGRYIHDDRDCYRVRRRDRRPGEEDQYAMASDLRRVEGDQ